MDYGDSKWKQFTHVCELYAFEHVNQPNQFATQLTSPPKRENMKKLAFFQPISLKLNVDTEN